MATEVKLFGFWTSPFVHRITWAMKLKGVDYEYIEEDIFNKSNRLLELNPVHKKVPVFVHDKKVIAESYVILEYVDETWQQNPLLPKDSHERAMARFWAKFADEKLLERTWITLWTQGEEKERAIEALEKIEEELKGKANYFGGECIGYLDIALGWISYLLPAWEQAASVNILDPEKFPAITAWSSKFLSHPVIKNNFSSKDNLVFYFQERMRSKGMDI